MSGDSRGGPADHGDRPTAENPGEKFTAHGTRNNRQKPSATPVFAEVREVVGGTGRQRSLLIYRCVLGCGRHHVAHGRGVLPAVLERPAACGRGRVAIIPAHEGRDAA